MRRLLLRYIQALMTQTAQLAVCNGHRAVEQRLCRLLLERLDRVQGRDIETTPEQIAHALGVRREGVTAAAVKLQAAGLIHSARGHISVLDRRQLAHHSCECYAAVRKEHDRLLARHSDNAALPDGPMGPGRPRSEQRAARVGVRGPGRRMMRRRVRFGVRLAAVLVALATGGSTLLPRRETVTTGWNVDDLLVYQWVGSQPTINEVEHVRIPLGCLRGWGGQVTQALRRRRCRRARRH